MQCELSVAVLNEAGEELATDDGDENGSDHTQEVLLEAQETNGDDQSVPESGAVEVTDVKPSQPKAVKSAPAVKSSRPRAPSVEVGDRVRVTWPGGRGEHDGEVVGVYPTLTGLKKVGAALSRRAARQTARLAADAARARSRPHTPAVHGVAHARRSYPASIANRDAVPRTASSTPPTHWRSSHWHPVVRRDGQRRRLRSSTTAAYVRGTCKASISSRSSRAPIHAAQLR